MLKEPALQQGKQAGIFKLETSNEKATLTAGSLLGIKNAGIATRKCYFAPLE